MTGSNVTDPIHFSGLYESCRYPGTDFQGGDLPDGSESIFPDITEEGTCVKKCFWIEECRGITLVNKANSSVHQRGCFLKSGEWKVLTGDRQANMVSVNVTCVRGRGKKNFCMMQALKTSFGPPQLRVVPPH